MIPEYKFPTSPLDCLRAYKFIVNDLHKYVNIKPKKVILAGESAGGNLAFVLSGLILKENLMKPLGIFSSYPSCDMRGLFSPSRVNSLSDPLLSSSVLSFIRAQYLEGVRENQKNPMASPIFMTEEFVGGSKGDTRFPLQWPRTIIQVGAKDPLYDDSIYMMEKMVSSNIPCQCQVYENLSHAFLTIDFAIKDSISHLKRLINNEV